VAVFEWRDWGSQKMGTAEGRWSSIFRDEGLHSRRVSQRESLWKMLTAYGTPLYRHLFAGSGTKRQDYIINLLYRDSPILLSI
jgi:hypothetical protein